MLLKLVMSVASKRFHPSRWSSCLVPALLILLVLGLLATLVLVGMSLVRNGLGR